MRVGNLSPTKELYISATTQPTHLQLWHELEIIQFIKNKPTSDPYIDQAKIYFLDAWNSSWRSAGLLYYYSFLNLVKSNIVAVNSDQESLSGKVKLFHGLVCKDQEIDCISDLKIEIKKHENSNAFTNFYSALFGQEWPFDRTVSFTLREIMGYIIDLYQENIDLFQIDSRGEPIKSISRINDNVCWGEFLGSERIFNKISSALPDTKLHQLKSGQLSSGELTIWLALAAPDQAIGIGKTFARTPFKSHLGKNQSETIKELAAEVTNLFKNHVYPRAYFDGKLLEWHFFEPLEKEGQKLFWNQLLSNYIMAFAIGSILRYHPHLLKEGSKGYFLIDAWIRQCPITTLREFVIHMKNPGVVVSHLT